MAPIVDYVWRGLNAARNGCMGQLRRLRCFCQLHPVSPIIKLNQFHGGSDQPPGAALHSSYGLAGVTTWPDFNMRITINHYPITIAICEISARFTIELPSVPGGLGPPNQVLQGGTFYLTTVG